MRNGGDVNESGNEKVLESRRTQDKILKGEPTGFAGGMFMTVTSLITQNVVFRPAASVSPGSL